MSRGTYGRTGNKDLAQDARRLKPFLAAGVDTYRVRVSADDTTPNFLEQKTASADTSVVITVTDPGADEGLDFSVAVYVAAEIATHAADPDAHHNQSHVLATTAGLGTDHTASGLTAGQVLRATGATTAAFASLQATDLPAHVIATNLALGSQHTISGAADGQVLRASSATAANFQALAHSDLSGAGANDHHNQVHGIVGSDHTVTGSALDVIGLSATDTLAVLTPSSDPTGAAILRTDADGRTGLEGIGILTAPDGDYIKVANGVAIGLGTAAGRLVFVDDTTDILRVLDADLHMNDGTNDTLRLRSSGDVGTQADILALGDLGIAAQDDCWVYIDANNNSTDAAVRFGKNAETSGGATEFHAINENGSEEWRSGVAHGMTTLARTATWGQIEENQTDSGGVLFRGLTDSSNTAPALRLSGVLSQTPDSTDTSSSYGAVRVEGSKKSGTTQQDLGTSENVFVVANRFTARLLVKGNGDLHVTNTTLVALDWYDDVQLARQMQIELSGGRGIRPSPMDAGLVYSRADLEAVGMLRGKFINVQGTINALLGAVAQLGGRVMELEAINGI